MAQYVHSVKLHILQEKVNVAPPPTKPQITLIQFYETLLIKGCMPDFHNSSKHYLSTSVVKIIGFLILRNVFHFFFFSVV